MTRTFTTLTTLGLLILGACKGDTKIQADPQTQKDLDSCRAAMTEKDKLCKSLEEDNARLMPEKGSPGAGDIVVAIEGNALTVRPGKPGETRPIDDKAAGEASKQFIDVVAKSRGAIQKCYEQALRKDTGLQARTVTLTVSASFSQAGGYKS